MSEFNWEAFIRAFDPDSEFTEDIKRAIETHLASSIDGRYSISEIIYSPFFRLTMNMLKRIQSGEFETAIPPLVTALEEYPFDAGAADALHLIDLFYMKMNDHHRCEITSLVGNRLRATLIDKNLEFDALVNLVRSCLLQKSFREGYEYGVLAERIRDDDADLLANMTNASTLAGAEDDEVIIQRFNKLKSISRTHATEVYTVLTGQGNFHPTFHESIDDLLPKFQQLRKGIGLEAQVIMVHELTQRPDSPNAWRCWKMLSEYHLSIMPSKKDGREYLRLQEMAGIAAASGKAIAFHPQNAENDYDLWYWRGKSLGELCFFEKAVDALEQAVRIKPSSRPALEALEYCNLMVSLDPEDERRPDSIAGVIKAREQLKAAKLSGQCPECGSTELRKLGVRKVACNNCPFFGDPSELK